MGMLQVATPRVERISHPQLFCAMVLFLLGTTWIFVPGAAMGRDAWIACVMGLVSGLLLVLIYLRLYALFPGESLFMWLPRLCGPFIGRLLGSIYIIYFLYICARNLRDIAELLRLSFMNRTPVLALTLLQAALVALGAYYGLETSSRVKVLILPGVLLMMGAVTIGLWMHRYPLHLFPILEYGLKPVWYYSFPTITTVPYGELVVFLVYLPLVRGRPQKTMIAATITGGLILILTAFMAVLVIGAANLADSTLPYYTMVRAITFGDVLQRMDGFIVPMLAFCAYAKACTFLIGSGYGIAHFMSCRRPASLCLPMGLMAAAWGTTMAQSWGQHLVIGLEIVPYALHIPLQVILPLLLWLFAEARNRVRPIQRPVTRLTGDTPPNWTRVVAAVLSLLLWLPMFFPAWLEKSPMTDYVLRPMAHWIGEPVVRALGGQPMKR